jgi:hypothetical protein
MRDVLSLVNSILCANSLALALSEGVPAVLQQHLDAMQQQVTQQLAPAGQGGTAAAQLQGQVSTWGSRCSYAKWYVPYVTCVHCSWPGLSVSSADAIGAHSIVNNMITVVVYWPVFRRTWHVLCMPSALHTPYLPSTRLWSPPCSAQQHTPARQQQQHVRRCCRLRCLLQPPLLLLPCWQHPARPAVRSVYCKRYAAQQASRRCSCLL